MFASFFGMVGLVFWLLFRARRAGEKLAASFGTPHYTRRFECHPNDREAAEHGGRIRFRPTSSVSPRVKAAIESLFGAAEVLLALHRRIDGGLLTLCEIRRKRTVPRWKNRPSYTVVEYQTVLLCEGREEVEFPPFSVVPRAGMIGTGVFNVLVGMLGSASIDAFQFAEDPEFQRRLMVGTTVASDVRPLLTANAREVLKKHCEFIVMANDDCVALTLPSRVDSESRRVAAFSNSRDRVESGLIELGDWRTFVSRGAEVIQTLRNEERATRAARMGAGGNAAQAELRALLKEPPPRPVPRRFVWGKIRSDPFLLLWSILAFVMATVVGTVFFLAATDKWWIGLIVLIVGFAMASIWPLYCWLSGRSKLRLVRHGRMLEATVVNVARGNTVFINGGSQTHRYTATFEYELDGTQRQATQSVWGGLGYRLTKLQQMRKATDVLVTPDQPKQVLWVDSLIKS